MCFKSPNMLVLGQTLMDAAVFKKIDRFFCQYQPLHFKKGEVIVRAEDPIFGIYFLKRGLVKQYVISKDGDEVTIHIFTSPSFFPMMLILGELENRYFFEAQTNVEVFRAPVDKTLRFVKEDPQVLFDLTKRFAQGLNGLSIRLENLMFEEAYKRVVFLLLYLAEKFGQKEDGKIIIELPLTHKDIASWINLTRETVSRQIEKLINKGLISHKNHQLIIYKLHQLEQETR